MVYLLALLIFAAIATATWFVGVAVYTFAFPAPDLRSNPDFAWASGVSALLVALVSLVPFPVGYLLSLRVWGMSAWGMLALPAHRAWLLFLTLASLSFLSRLAVLGALGL